MNRLYPIVACGCFRGSACTFAHDPDLCPCEKCTWATMTCDPQGKGRCTCRDPRPGARDVPKRHSAAPPWKCGRCLLAHCSPSQAYAEHRAHERAGLLDTLT